MNLLFKKIQVPESYEEIEAVELWEVQWRSRHDEYSSGTKPAIEVFTSLELAKRFAEALKSAFKLIKHTSGTEVTVTKVK